jgi:hypothetical protein
MMGKRNAPKSRRCRDARVENRDPHHANAAHSAGLPQAIPLAIPTSWTPEEALAVFELVDDLRDRIWSFYQINLQDLMRQQRQPEPIDLIQTNDDDPSF